MACDHTACRTVVDLVTRLYMSQQCTGHSAGTLDSSTLAYLHTHTHTHTPPHYYSLHRPAVEQRIDRHLGTEFDAYDVERDFYKSSHLAVEMKRGINHV